MLNETRRFFRMSVAVLLSAACVTAPASAGAPRDASQIPDTEYVRVTPDGHLALDGKRVRYWGFIGTPFAHVKDELTGAERARAIAKTRADIDLSVERIYDLGFNIYRNWLRISNDDYQPGDGTPPDLTAYFFHKLDQKGIRIWNAMLGHVTDFSPEDVNIIHDPDTADEWKAAVEEWVKSNGGKRVTVWNIARAWDPRIEAIGLAQMKKNASFRNRYKGGLALADDPQVIVWELTNEEWWYRNMFSGWSFSQLPSYFRNQLLMKWRDFLWDKYGTEEDLVTAWNFLLPGESLYEGTIMLAPLGSPSRAEVLANDTNPAAIALLKSHKQTYTRDDFARRRGEDVLEFITNLFIAHKQREADAVKSWGKSCRLSPCIWDTGNCFQIQSGYMFQFSDASVCDTYMKGMGHDPTSKRWPFYSGLEAPPRMGWNVPWVEQARQKGKPTFVYETQIDCRTKYRAEYPMRIAALAAIQDWDIVNWHTYDSAVDSSNEDDPFGRRLHVWHDYLGFGQDEVQLSNMKACAEVFKSGLLAPAPNPTTFIFGRKSLYDPMSMDYGKSYGDAAHKIIPTCYRYGAQILIDPTREDDAVEGPTYHEDILIPNPVKPNEQIEYDWAMGHLKFDAPGVIGYVGFYGQRDGPVTFSSGASFTDVTIENPDGIAYPVTPDEGYVAVIVASQDGKPLSEATRAVVSAVSTSFNSEYKLDYTKSTQGMHRDGPKHVPPREWFGAWAENPGTSPVLVARVGVTIKCKEIDGMRYILKDWNMREIGRGTVTRGELVISADAPVFVIELER